MLEAAQVTPGVGPLGFWAQIWGTLLQVIAEVREPQQSLCHLHTWTGITELDLRWLYEELQCVHQSLLTSPVHVQAGARPLHQVSGDKSCLCAPPAPP